MKAIKERLARFGGLVGCSAREVLDPKNSTCAALGHLACLVLVGPVAFVAVVIFGCE